MACRLRDGGDTVLVRVYGPGTSLMIDRVLEIKSMVLLHSLGMAAPVFCRFDNGMAYGYQPGAMLDNVTVRKHEIQRYKRELIYVLS